MISVFYDDKCKLCSRKIFTDKRIAPKAKKIASVPCGNKKDLKSANIRVVDSLMYLHAKDCKGNFHIGVDAFIIIWSKLPYFKYLNYIISLPGIYQFASYFYGKFAKYRFNKLEHCQIAFKKTK